MATVRSRASHTVDGRKASTYLQTVRNTGCNITDPQCWRPLHTAMPKSPAARLQRGRLSLFAKPHQARGFLLQEINHPILRKLQLLKAPAQIGLNLPPSGFDLLTLAPPLKADWRYLCFFHLTTFINFSTFSKIPDLSIFQAKNTHDELLVDQYTERRKTNKGRKKGGGGGWRGVGKILSVYSKQGFKCSTNKT